MSQLVCPMCSESLNTAEGAHFYKHFRYKRYACGESNCRDEFYTEAERLDHCNQKKHKRSFQKTVNPYIDKLISIVAEDARELATKDMNIVLENRWGDRQEGTSEATNTKKKRNSLAPTTSSTTPVVPPKKARAVGGGPTGISVVKPTSSTHQATGGAKQTFAVSSTRREISSPQPPAPPIPSTSSANLPIVDSTTNDHNYSSKPSEPPKKTRKKRASGTSMTTERQETTEEVPMEITRFHMLMSNEEQKDPVKYPCSVCNKDVDYDFLDRIDHVSRNHMSADIDEKDYEDVLLAQMNKSFPELPNSHLNCQMCVNPGETIINSKQRQHIETRHVNQLLELFCPICEVPYNRQCDLSKHMKNEHKTSLTDFKEPGKTLSNSPFHILRNHRNAMIIWLRQKCFPREIKSPKKVEKRKKGTESPLIPPPDSYFESDVRLKDAHKTRRAPQYNDKDSSDGSDEDDDSTSSITPGPTTAMNSQDIIYIGRKFYSEVAKNLEKQRQGAAPLLMNIKAEVIQPEEETVEQQPQQQPVRRDAMKPEVEDPPLAENRSDVPELQQQQHPCLHIAMPTPFLAQYEPTVPPPGYSPSPIHSHPSPSYQISTNGGVNAPVLNRIISPETPPAEKDQWERRSRSPRRAQFSWDDDRNRDDNNRRSSDYRGNYRRYENRRDTYNNRGSYNNYHNNYRGGIRNNDRNDTGARFRSPNSGADYRSPSASRDFRKRNHD